MTTTTTHDRWKYAEEAAKDLIDKGHHVVVAGPTTTTHVEDEGTDDEETYVIDVFTVIDLGKREQGERNL